MGAIGGARCQYHLRQILVFLDAMVMNKPEFMGGVIQNKVDPQTGEVVDQSTRDHLSGQLTAFGDYIKRVKRKRVRAALTSALSTGEGKHKALFRRNRLLFSARR
jgi:NAD(P)H-dependent FMN reductase